MNRKCFFSWLSTVAVMMVGVCLLGMSSCKEDEDSDDLLKYRYWENMKDSYIRTMDKDFAFQLYKVRRESRNLVIEYSLTNVGSHSNTLTMYTHDQEPVVVDNSGGSYKCHVGSNSEVQPTMDGKSFREYGWGKNFDFKPGQPMIGTVTVIGFSEKATQVSMTLYAVPTSGSLTYRTLEFVNVPIETDDKGVVYNRLSTE